MAQFNELSLEHLSSCHADLQRLFLDVVADVDCKILEGHRVKDRQEMYFSTGKSKVHWPDSKHNRWPAEAVDVAPCPINWNDTARFYYLAAWVLARAKSLGIKIRWGGDWDGDHNFKEHSFKDLDHFELIA